MGQVSEQLVTANVVVKNWGPEVKKEEAKIDQIKDLEKETEDQ